MQGVDSDQDSEEFRADDSMIGVVIGNWSIAASTQQRWWGPGWDGSLILGNNARPIPSLVLDRVFTDGFESKWLSWIGPWDLNVMFGQLEKERVVPNAQFFGMRVQLPADTVAGDRNLALGAMVRRWQAVRAGYVYRPVFRQRQHRRCWYRCRQ